MRNILLSACLFMCACCASIPKERIFGAKPLEPEAWYEDIYESVEHCAKLLGQYSGIEFDDIEFYVVPPGSMGDFVGLFSIPNRIYYDAGYVLNGPILKHEMGHAALKKPFNEHENPAFITCTQP